MTAIEALPLIVAAGEKAGYWQALPMPARDSGHWYQGINVWTHDACTFTLSANTRDKTITATVASLNDGQPHDQGVRVFASDVVEYRATVPSASVSPTRDPAALAKSLNARIVALPEARALAALVRERLRERIAMRESLLANIERMKALGFTLAPHHPPLSEFSEATMYRPGTPTARVTCGGKVYLERVTVGLDHVGDALKLFAE